MAGGSRAVLLASPPFPPSAAAAGSRGELSLVGFPHTAHALKIPNLIAFSYYS